MAPQLYLYLMIAILCKVGNFEVVLPMIRYEWIAPSSVHTHTYFSVKWVQAGYYVLWELMQVMHSISSQKVVLAEKLKEKK